MVKLIISLISLVLLLIYIYRLIITLSKLQCVNDIEKLSKTNSSKLLTKTGIAFDKSTNKIVTDQDIIL